MSASQENFVEILCSRKFHVLAWFGLMLLSGCTFRKVAYHHSEWLVLRGLDSYLDLSRNQKTKLKPKIVKQVNWLKDELKGEFRSILSDFQTRAERGLTPQDLEWANDQVRLAYLKIVDHVLPDLLNLASQLDEGQLDHLTEKFEAGNHKESEILQESPQDFLRKRQKQLVERTEDWLGPLSDDQVTKMSGALLFTQAESRQYFELRRSRQKELVAALRQKPQDLGRLTNAFRDLIAAQEPESATQAAMRASRLTKLTGALKYVTEVQWRQFAREIGNLISDFCQE